jgi:ferric-dicitrate binding protein FerR (iron transport regulator)
MSLKSENEEIIEAIAAMLAGVATGEDEQRVTAWRAAAERNEAFFQRLTRGNLLEERLEELRREDVLAAWQRVEEAMGWSSRRRLHVGRWLAGAAAAVVALVMAVVALTRHFQPVLPCDEGSTVAELSPSTAQLVLSDGSTISIDEANPEVIRDSAGIVIHRERGFLDYSRNNSPRDTQPIFNEVIMPPGVDYAMTLSDGTRVFLNAESKLRFPVKFGGKRRVIELEGEGYFEVTRDEEHPFVVRAGGMEVTVLGTEFNLRAYNDEPSVSTTLVTGSVQVSNGKESLLIVPGEQGVYERNSRAITARQVDVTLYTAWRHGEIKFKDMPLEQVMRDLTRWYGISYEFLDDEARGIEFGGCFERFSSIHPILGMLRRTELVNVTVENGKIYISTKK